MFDESIEFLVQKAKTESKDRECVCICVCVYVCKRAKFANKPLTNRTKYSNSFALRDNSVTPVTSVIGRQAKIVVGYQSNHIPKTTTTTRKKKGKQQLLKTL